MTERSDTPFDFGKGYALLFFRVLHLPAHFTPVMTVLCPLDDTLQRREAAWTAGIARHLAAGKR